jgi:hypothetical protein
MKGELICLILLGRGPDGYAGMNHPYPPPRGEFAEIRIGGTVVGRSYPLADTVRLAQTTDQVEALRKAAKTATRVVLKKTVSETVGHSANNEALGALVYLILMMMEQPDIRRWETLPRYFHVARVPCPAHLKSFQVSIRGAGETALKEFQVETPICRRRNTYVSVVLILPAARTPLPMNRAPGPGAPAPSSPEPPGARP